MVNLGELVGFTWFIHHRLYSPLSSSDSSMGGLDMLLVVIWNPRRQVGGGGGSSGAT